MIVNLLVGLVLMIAGYLLQPKPKPNKPAEVTEMEGPTAEAGKPIPVIFGDIWVKSPNYLWWGDKTYASRSQRTKKKRK